MITGIPTQNIFLENAQREKQISLSLSTKSPLMRQKVCKQYAIVHTHTLPPINTYYPPTPLPQTNTHTTQIPPTHTHHPHTCLPTHTQAHTDNIKREKLYFTSCFLLTSHNTPFSIFQKHQQPGYPTWYPSQYPCKTSMNKWKPNMEVWLTSGCMDLKTGRSIKVIWLWKKNQTKVW